MRPPEIETSTEEERRQYVKNTFPCIADFVWYFVEKIRSLPHAAYKKIPTAALQKLETPMNLICVTPVKAEVLCSEFKEDIYWKNRRNLQKQIP